MLKEAFSNLNTVAGVKDISDTDSAAVCGGLAGLDEHGITFNYKNGTQKYTELTVDRDKKYYPGKKIASVSIFKGFDPGGATLYYKIKGNGKWRKAGTINGVTGTWNWNAPRGGVAAFRVGS